MPKKNFKKKRFNKKHTGLTVFSPKLRQNAGTYRIIFSAVDSILNNTGSVAVIAQAFSLHHPSYFRNQGGTWGQMGTSGGQINNIIALYDEYKVNAMRVRVIPAFQDTSNPGTSYIPLTTYMCYDWDDDSLLTSETSALNCGALPISLLAGTQKNITRTMFPKKQHKGRYTNTSQIGVAKTVTTTQGTVVPEDFYGAMKVLSPNVNANTLIATLHVEWDVTFRGLRYA